MRLSWTLLIGSVLSLNVTAANVDGVFSDLTVTKDGSTTGDPRKIWTANLKWDLPAGKYAPGDTFKLELPCVSIERTASAIDLKSGGVSYANCKDVTKDSWKVAKSVYMCQILPPVIENISISGVLKFPLRFNIGGARDDASMTCAKKFKLGKNIITWSDGKNALSTIATFDNGGPTNELNIGVFRRTDVENSVRYVWLVHDYCPKGYKSITYSQKFIDAFKLDCANTHGGATNDWNAWYRPKSYLGNHVTRSCEAHKMTVTLNNVPAGARAAMDTRMNFVPGEWVEVVHDVKYVCQGTTKELTATATWSTAPAKEVKPGSAGDVIIFTTKTYTGSTTRATTLSKATGTGDKTITIEIDVPTPTTTITQTYLGTATTTVTIPATTGGTGTLIIQVPTPETTFTLTGTGTAELTITRTAASSGGNNTVIIVKPTTYSETTLTSTGTGTSEYTITETAASSGGTNTVIVVKPTTFSETTLTLTGTGTSEYTITETAATSGGTNTVIVVKPTTFSETTLYSTGTGTSEYTTTETAASSGGTNTVIVVKPTTFSETTLTLTGTGTSEYTITETAASSGGTNTVIVVKPTTFSETTLTLTGTGTSEYTITETAASSGGTNTVIVVKPTTFSETTLFSTGTGTSEYTITETAASSGGTNTVIVVKPSQLSLSHSLVRFWNTSSASPDMHTSSFEKDSSTTFEATTTLKITMTTASELCTNCVKTSSTAESLIASYSSQLMPSFGGLRDAISTPLKSELSEHQTLTDYSSRGSVATLILNEISLSDDTPAGFTTTTSNPLVMTSSGLTHEMSSSSQGMHTITINTLRDGSASVSEYSYSAAFFAMILLLA